MKTQTDWIGKELSLLKSHGLYNKLRVVKSPIDAQVKINGGSALNFSSNNYLGLANHPRLRRAAKAAIDKYGVGPAAVRTISGTTVLHVKLEEKLAKFKKVEAALVFQSGFNANIAVIPAITGEGDIIFSDERNHASIIDGTRLSKAQVIQFKHKDMADLESKIKEHKKRRRGLIITDGVFSMDGDIAPLPAIVKLAKKYKLMTMVDDAHGEGVLGSHGRGIVDHFKLHGMVDIEIGTMSKAFGVVGGIVAGSNELIDWLKQRGRPFLFSSALSIPDTGACIEAVNILQGSEKLVKKLWSNAEYLKSGLVKIGYDIGNSETPIIPVILGEAGLARKFSDSLFKNGLLAMAIVYPTVPMGTARVRVMNSAAHTKGDLDEALRIFEKVGKNLNVV